MNAYVAIAGLGFLIAGGYLYSENKAKPWLVLAAVGAVLLILVASGLGAEPAVGYNPYIK